MGGKEAACSCDLRPDKGVFFMMVRGSPGDDTIHLAATTATRTLDPPKDAVESDHSPRLR